SLGPCSTSLDAATGSAISLRHPHSCALGAEAIQRPTSLIVDLGTGSCPRLTLRWSAVTSHPLGGEFEDLVRCGGRALTDGCGPQIAPRVTARRPRIPLRFALHTRSRRERTTAGAPTPRCRSQNWRRCIHAPQHELELPKLKENVFDPSAQFVVQCVGQIGRRCLRKLAERKCLPIDQCPQ